MYLELQVGNRRASVKRLLIRQQALIGRQAHCDVRVVSDEISREHCRLEVRNSAAFLIDLGSTNGTFLNQKRMEAHSEVALMQDDVILVGPAAFTVNLIETTDEQSLDQTDDAKQKQSSGTTNSSPESKTGQFSEEQLEDILNHDSAESPNSDDSLLAGVNSDGDMNTVSEDDAFDKYLKDL